MTLFGVCLLSLPLLAAGTSESVLIGDRQMSDQSLKRLSRDIGSVGGTDTPSGFLILKLAPGVTVNQAKRILRERGVDCVLPGSVTQTNTRSIQSVRDRITYERSWRKLKGIDDEGPDVYEAILNYLEVRTDQFGNLNRQAYVEAAAHRDQMPGAKPEWFTHEMGVQNTTSLWSYVGPRDLQVPRQKYFGVRPISGRKNDVAYAPSNPSIIYTASAGGGIWKSTDSGTNWTPLSDDWPYLHTSAVAVDPTDANVVFAGTGDYNGWFTVQSFGIMRSLDGGIHWTNYGNADFGDKIVSHIVVCPDDPNRIIATVGKGSDTLGGVWLSTNRGVSWTKTTCPGGDWDDCDVAKLVPYRGSHRIWACGGGAGGTKIAYSDDRGDTWHTVTKPSGFSSSEQFMNIAASRHDWDGAYIVGVNNYKVYKTFNGGTGWTDISSGIPSGDAYYNWSQRSYDLHITCGDTGTSDVIYLGLITLCASDDYGATWSDIAMTYDPAAKWHNDQHCFAAHPTIANRGIAGADGGLARVDYSTSTNSATFTMLNANLFDTQLYGMSLHPSSGLYIQAGAQDNGSPVSMGDLNHWNNLKDNDGGRNGFDGTSPVRHYTTWQGGHIFRYDTATSTTPTDLSLGSAPFITPLAMGGPGYRTVYSVSGSKIYRNAFGTSGWSASVQSPGTANNIQNTTLEPNRLYATFNSGQMWMTTDAGVNWSNKTGNLPNQPVGDAAESPSTPYYVIAALMHTNGSYGHVYRAASVNTASPSWTNISGSGSTGLPNMPANTVLRDPSNLQYYYVGTDVGCFMTPNAGVSWYNMNVLGLPNVAVRDLWYGGGYMYAATFGRGIWKIRLGVVKLTNLLLSTYKVYGGQSFNAYVYLDYGAGPGTVVSVTDDSAYVTTSSITVPVSSTSAGKSMTTTSVSSAQNVTVTASFGGVSYSRTLTVYPVPTVISQTFNPNPVYGGYATVMTVILNAPVPIDTTLVYSDSTTLLSPTASSVVVPTGGTSGAFTLATGVVPTLTAAQADVAVAPKTSLKYSASVDIDSLPVPTAHVIVPGSVTGGNTARGTITLSKPAPPGGARVLLSDNSTFASEPTVALVPAGLTQGSYSITTTAVAKVVRATVYGRYNGVTVSASLTINP